MASSRIFVRGLPPSITESDFRKHFSAKNREITDIRLFPKRRIGYVGYKTAKDAESAVKYFNKSFIRMSRLAVEPAKPIFESRPAHQPTKSTNSHSALPDSQSIERAQDGRKRKRTEVNESNPKFKEYIQVMLPKQTPEAAYDGLSEGKTIETAQASVAGEESDKEYEDVRLLKRKREATLLDKCPNAEGHNQSVMPTTQPPPSATGPADSSFKQSPVKSLATAAVIRLPGSATDDQWLRSRTSRQLDLVDIHEVVAHSRVVEAIEQEPTQVTSHSEYNAGVSHVLASEPSHGQEAGNVAAPTDSARGTCRLFVRNLPFAASSEDVREHFEVFGSVEEVHIPVDKQGSSKGFAFVLFNSETAALEALKNLDGTAFQGRLLHILPGEEKRNRGLDEFAISKLPLKTQNAIKKRAQAASSSFNWNSLFLNQDAVNSVVAERLGISKSELLDPTSSEAAVKQAIAETNVIQETKAYFVANGVDLNAFKSSKRGNISILVKNFPHGISVEQLRTMFEAHGPVLRVLMPPSGTIAIVQFAQEAHAKIAYSKLAYSRIENSVLFLEKGPSDLFGKDSDAAIQLASKAVTNKPIVVLQKPTVDDLIKEDEKGDVELATTSLFVRNLAFLTTSAKMEDAFRSLKGFVSARVKTKTDAKRPGQVLSMGFGFVEFRTKENALAALKAMDGFSLDGHALSVKASHKGLDAAEERRLADKAKKVAGKQTKIIIKNLPFEATKKDVRALFGAYGQLRAVRVPKKFDRSRGFGFAEFITPREAELALNALRDTHLLGRRLVLEYAEADAIDPEEEIARMQRKIGGQVNKVALQQLTGKGRTKVHLGNEGSDVEEN